MSHFQGKTYWLIGASEGLGREIAIQLDAMGANLILSARNEERLRSLQSQLTDARVIPIDVMELDAVRRAVAEAGRVDGIVFCAGDYDPMSTQAWDTEAAIRVNDINFVGAMRVLGETVPKMVRLGQGDITLIGSLSGYRGLPAAIGYGPSKAALVSLAETMRHDLKGTGVTVRIINPGFVKTRLTEKNEFSMPQLMDAKTAAAKTVKAMQSTRFRTDFPAPFAWFIKSLNYLPDWLIYRGK